MIEFQRMNPLPATTPLPKGEGAPEDGGAAFTEMLSRSLGRQTVGRFAELNGEEGANNGETGGAGAGTQDPSAWPAAAVISEVIGSSAITYPGAPTPIPGPPPGKAASPMAPAPDAGGLPPATAATATPATAAAAGAPPVAAAENLIAVSLDPAGSLVLGKGTPEHGFPELPQSAAGVPTHQNPWVTLLGSVEAQTRSMAQGAGEGVVGYHETGDTAAGATAPPAGNPLTAAAPQTADASVTAATIAADAAARARAGLSPLRAALAGAGENEPQAAVAVGGMRVLEPAPHRAEAQTGSILDRFDRTAITEAVTARIAAPPPTASSSTPAAILHRVMNVVEMQALQPPPRSMVVELPELDGLRITVSLRGSEVHIVTGDRSDGAALFRPFQTEIAAALDAHGLDLWLESGEQSAQRQADSDDTPAPKRRRNIFRRAQRPADDALRI